ncbi:MAG: tRNA (adenosine(37)-N6)-threonylcarbamoyltransferase complex transferase subunit TsaD [Candidatus Eiseniibacteriota bacterium]
MILGIETSCDETAAAVLDDRGTVLSNVVASQSVHELYGGIVPEIASREHVRKLVPVIRRALENAGTSAGEVRSVAVTAGPGLVGALLVGLTAAKSFALSRGLPWIGVNHLEGHVMSPFLEERDLSPPVLVLVASGGHTLLVRVDAFDELEVVGRTRDDAAGEAFDKVSVLLGRGYPGGARIERLAEGGNERAFDFPRTRLEPGTLDFSFSGIKTAVRVALERNSALREEPGARDVAASFQAAMVDMLVARTMEAATAADVPAVAVAGGVAANGPLRRAMAAECERRRLRLVVPRLEYCGDNAAMIAFAGKLRLDRGETSPFSLDADANLSLGAVANRAPRRRGRG